MNVDAEPLTRVLPLIAMPLIAAVAACRTEMTDRLSPPLDRFTRSMRRLGRVVDATPDRELTDTEADRLLAAIHQMSRPPYNWQADPDESDLATAISQHPSNRSRNAS